MRIKKTKETLYIMPASLCQWMDDCNVWLNNFGIWQPHGSNCPIVEHSSNLETRSCRHIWGRVLLKYYGHVVLININMSRCWIWCAFWQGGRISHPCFVYYAVFFFKLLRTLNWSNNLHVSDLWFLTVSAKLMVWKFVCRPSFLRHAFIISPSVLQLSLLSLLSNEGISFKF